MRRCLAFLTLCVATTVAVADKKYEVVVKKDLAYGKEEKQKLDLYIPKEAKDFPVLVFVHGGGYQKGDRHECVTLGETFAARGVGVAAISYRLYPQAKHPAQIQDVATAFAFVKSHAKEHGANSSKISVGGHSAGAHLATLLATDARYLKAEKLALSEIASVVSISGGYRILPIRKDVFGSQESMDQASPFAHIKGGHPPTFILYGDGDSAERHAISKEFDAALQKAGTKTKLQMIKDHNHAELFSKIGNGDATTEAVIDYLLGNSK